MLAAPTLIALLGAECTGKSTLVAALASSLVAAGIDAVAVPEYLREFCATHGRTPCVDEQRDIACEQSSRISRAAERHAVVVADTTAFMTAVYSEALFGDTSLYADAASAHRDYRQTLLAGLEIPWVADGLQGRDWMRSCVWRCCSGECRLRCWSVIVPHGSGRQFVWCSAVLRRRLRWHPNRVGTGSASTAATASVKRPPRRSRADSERRAVGRIDRPGAAGHVADPLARLRIGAGWRKPGWRAARRAPVRVRIRRSAPGSGSPCRG